MLSDAERLWERRMGRTRGDHTTSPPWLVEYMGISFGGFKTDVCARTDTAVVRYHFTEERSCLAPGAAWRSPAWMNPPHSDPQPFIAAAKRHAENGVTTVCLLPVDTSTEWFATCLAHAQIIFLVGRLKYGGNRSSARFPSMLAIFGPGRAGTLPTTENVAEMQEKLVMHKALFGKPKRRRKA